MQQFLLPGLLAVLLTLMLTPLIEQLTRWAGLIEYPGERRIHRKPVPVGGGMAIFLSFWLTVLLTGQWHSQLWGLFCASTIMLLVGLLDDWRSLHPGWKFLGQLGAAAVLISSGTRIEFVTNPFGGMVYLAIWSIPITLLWLITVTNVVNFIDGLD